jgi:hypothetical protein
MPFPVAQEVTILQSRKRPRDKDALHLHSELSHSFNGVHGVETNELPATPTSLLPQGAEAMDNVPPYLSSETLKRKLLDNYVAYVHPLFPVIDVAAVQNEHVGFFIQQGKERLSPLVFLSVLYSAIPHVNTTFLKAEGYNSHGELGEAIRRDFKVSFRSSVRPSFH